MEAEKLIFELNDDEDSWWSESIKNFRSRLVKEPRSYTDKILSERGITREQLEKNVDTLLADIREEVWQLYLIDEANFHKDVLSYLVESREIPKNILVKLIDNRILEDDYTSLSREDLVNRIAEISPFQ